MQLSQFIRLSGCLCMVAWLSSFSLVQAQGRSKKAPQIAPTAMLAPGPPIPFDPETRTGTLPNGMRYYVRQNAKPENYAELRLAVNAGSIQESDKQLGLAHFVEHMCFNGTKNFPKSDLVNYLESIGTKFGAHLNAYTSFDETVYMLRVPTDNEEQFVKGFQILEDWAHNVTMSDEEIDKERGVVIEEWRTRLGANNRISQKTYPKVYYGSRYVNRLPIGDTAVLKTFDYETLRSFYRDWYRPNLMAIVAVGDFDVDQVVAQIQSQFGAIPNPEDAPEREVYPIPDHKETLIAMASDEEAAFNRIQVLYKHPLRETKTLRDYRRTVVYSLASSMIDARLSELIQSENPPFNYVSSGYRNMARNKDQYSTFAIVPNGSYLKSLEAILTENARATQHGFTESELARVKQSVLTGLQQRYSERDKTESRRLVMRYVYHFLDEDPVPGIEKQLELYQKMLPSITLEEVNDAFRSFITEENRTIVLSGAQRDDNPLPAEETVRKLLTDVNAKELTPYEDNVAVGPLMAETPEPVAVASRKTIEEIGVTELTFPNGVHVILKPTDFQNNEVSMTAFSPGGLSLYPDETYMSASRADNVIAESGVADFDNIQLEKYLSDKVVRLAPYIDEEGEGMRGASSANDLETFLQLVHLYFTKPRKDPKAFNSMMTKTKALYANLLSNPAYWFQDQLLEDLYQGHFRQDFIESPEKLDQVDLETAYRIYQERFGNAGDFTFVFVGTFDVAQMEQLLARYLGSLPGTPDEETWKDSGIRALSKSFEKTYYRGKEPQSQVQMRYGIEAEWDLKERFHLNSAVEVLRIMMRESMREEQGGVYGVRASAGAQRWPTGSYSVNVSFTCAPENVEQLRNTVLAEVKTLQQDGPSEQNMTKVQEMMRKDYQVNLNENRYWLQSLSFAYENGLDPTRILSTQKRIDALTAKDVQQAAQRFLKEEHLAQFILRPEPADETR